MPQSLKNRLNGNTPEFLKDVEHYGIFHAMEKYQIKDYLAAKKLIERETGNPNFGVVPKVDRSSGRDLGIQIVEALASYISRNEALNRKQAERIDYLEYQLRLEGIRNEEKTIGILEMLKDG